MKTFKAICLKDAVFTEDDRTLRLERGKEYIVSTIDNAGTVTVFSTYWASGIPSTLFGGLIPGPGEKHEPSNCP